MDEEGLEAECELCKIDFADYPNAPLEDENEKTESGLFTED